MSIRLLNCRLSSLIFVVQRSVVIRSDFDLANRMKELNSERKYEKTIELFHEHKQIDDKTNRLAIEQADHLCENSSD